VKSYSEFDCDICSKTVRIKIEEKYYKDEKSIIYYHWEYRNTRVYTGLIESGDYFCENCGNKVQENIEKWKAAKVVF
jgi:hypothetical protein